MNNDQERISEIYKELEDLYKKIPTELQETIKEIVDLEIELETYCNQ